MFEHSVPQTSRKLEREQLCHTAVIGTNEVQYCKHGGRRDEWEEDEEETGGDGDDVGVDDAKEEE